jgi:WD40 repeat protein
MADLDELLKSRGTVAELGAHIVAARFNRTGSHAAFALGDGSLHLFDAQAWNKVTVHDGAVLSLAAHPVSGGFCSGGDDGRLMAVTPEGQVSEIVKFGSKWVEQVAGFAGKTPLIAAAAGKNLYLLNGKGEVLRTLAHPSTVTGIAFDTKGKRVATSHYGGASLWFTSSNTDARKLEWKGSHIGIALHPAGEALVTAMQENSLHGWTLPEGKHMRMAGYPSKTEALGFTRSGRWLASAGAESVVLWPFFGGGPMGKAPMELGTGDGIVKRVATHPEHEVVAAGFDTGMVIIADVQKEQILPVCGPGRGAITALDWDATGARLAIGTETGFAAVVNFAR